MLGWILLGLFIAVVTVIITLIWWWVGDQWADDEYKKFGHGGGARTLNDRTRVIADDGTPKPAVIKETHDK